MKNNLGLIYAFSAYTWWGIIPIFWKQLDHIDSVEIVMHRIVWSAVLVTLLIVVTRQWAGFKALYSQPKVLLRLFIASVLISTNWGVYIWAVTSGHIVEASLGYFMNPLISVLLAMVLFGETLRRGQIFALSIAAFGVVYLIFSLGTFPWIACVLAVSFSLYSAAKKSINVAATHGMAVETLFLLLPALIYLSYIEASRGGQFSQSVSDAWLLTLGGLFTLIPLLLFAAAAKKISLTALGMTQYIGPTLQLLIGVLLFNEPFGGHKMIAFGLIWLALAIYSIDQIWRRKKRQ